MIAIDMATTELDEAIGQVLTQHKKEDASGARRCIAGYMEQAEFETAARLLGTTGEEAKALYQRFAG